MQNTEILQNIQDDIVTCRLLPGSPLQEVSLAEKQFCGRTKIRDALLVLSSQKFVVLEHNKGAHVAPLDASQVFSIFEMRIALEKSSAVLAASRLGEEGRQQLSNYHVTIQQAKRDQDENLFYEVDAIVHDAIASASLNPFLQSQIALMRLHTRRCWYFYRERGYREVADYKGLLSVIEEVCAGNAAGASAAMFDHLAGLHQSFSEMFSSQLKGLEHI
ncbi:GntR family transcriptional regulator [Roseibium album]|uniref:GntR family transcriptional regulator n=1 Tax=Roseibium album TaxID=311410 RepID=UPI003BB17692